MAENLFGTSVPTFANDAAADPVTLGLRVCFSDTATITKIRFYKTNALDSGTHDAAIWNNTGSQQLATATFSGETATGWQEVTLTTPLRVEAGYYIVGVYHPNGNFGYQANKFGASAHPAPSGGWLAPKAISTRGNGAFTYATGLQLPNSGSLQYSWYLIDLEIEHPGAWPSSLMFDQEFDTGGSDGPYTMGTRFTTDTDGQVLGVRWYHHESETDGSVTVLLYDGAGNQLASRTAVVPTNEVSQWKRLDFTAPISINPGQTYTAAYVTSQYYHGDSGFFTAAWDRPPLHAPANAGRFNVGITPGYPTSSFSNGNYFVDPVVTYDFTGWDMSV